MERLAARIVGDGGSGWMHFIIRAAVAAPGPRVYPSAADPPIRRSADPPIRRSADPPIRRSADPPIRPASIEATRPNAIRSASIVSVIDVDPIR
jgi:hypothetical protein